VSGKHYKWILVALLWVVALLNYLDRQVIFSVFPLLKADLKVSDVQLGFLGTAFLWVYGLLSPCGGYIADRFGRRRVILLSIAVWSAVNKVWLLRVSQPCIRLEDTNAIKITSQMEHKVTARFDYVDFAAQHCQIQEIRPIDYTAMRKSGPASSGT